MTVTLWTRDGLGSTGGYSHGLSPLDYDDDGDGDDKPHNKIVIGKVSSP